MVKDSIKIIQYLTSFSVVTFLFFSFNWCALLIKLVSIFDNLLWLDIVPGIETVKLSNVTMLVHNFEHLENWVLVSESERGIVKRTIFDDQMVNSCKSANFAWLSLVTRRNFSALKTYENIFREILRKFFAKISQKSILCKTPQSINWIISIGSTPNLA